MMDHPNIARGLDAGATDSGRPYFVMELVKGVPITEYCDKNKLSTAKRQELFMPVCHAIQHAHQKGIIHLDIKPANVMVTLHDGNPVPKVIDFGIAKATNQKLTEKTLFTNYAQMIGTPACMSPEQAEIVADRLASFPSVAVVERLALAARRGDHDKMQQILDAYVGSIQGPRSREFRSALMCYLPSVPASRVGIKEVSRYAKDVYLGADYDYGWVRLARGMGWRWAPIGLEIGNKQRR